MRSEENPSFVKVPCAMKVQPRKGRYFPVGPSLVAAATHGWELKAWWARTPFRFDNPDASYHDRRPLIRLWPCELLDGAQPGDDFPLRLGVEVAAVRPQEELHSH